MMTTNRLAPPKERQGRLHRKNVDNPRRLTDIERWDSTLEMLTLFPGLTAQQLGKLLFLNLPNTQNEPRATLSAAQKAANFKCLSHLKNLGLVAVKGLPRPGKLMARWELNYLTTIGYQALLDHRESLVQAPPLPYRDPAKLTPTEVDWHFMAAQDDAVSAIAAVLRSEITVERYWNDMDIRSLRKQGQLDWPMEPAGPYP